MSSQSRLLRVLVIHDTTFRKETPRSVLGTNDVTLCRIDNRHAGVAHNILRSWEETLLVLHGLTTFGDQTEVTLEVPDLVLVDCDFGQDTGAPNLPSSSVYDPRGLVYGATLCAFFLGSHPRRPLGFWPYSQHFQGVADDPYAQTFFSLMLALLNRVEFPVPSGYFKRLMAAEPSTPKPGEVLARALGVYRTSLREALENHLLPDFDVFEQAALHVAAFLEHGTPIPDDAMLSWKDYRGHQEDIALRSLFADCRKGQVWNAQAVRDNDVAGFLDYVLADHNVRDLILHPVRETLSLVYKGGEPQDWPHRSTGYSQKTLAFTIAWALERCRTNYYQSENLGITGIKQCLGLEFEATVLNRALGPTLMNATRYQAQTYIDLLDNAIAWPFPSPAWLPLFVRDYLARWAIEDLGLEDDPHGHADSGTLVAQCVGEKYWPQAIKHIPEPARPSNDS